MQFSISVNRQPIYADGTSTVLWVDFTEDLNKLNIFQNKMPIDVRNVTAGAQAADGQTIPFTFVRQGCRLKITFDSAPSKTLIANPAVTDNAFSVGAEFLFPTDK